MRKVLSTILVSLAFASVNSQESEEFLKEKPADKPQNGPSQGEDNDEGQQPTHDSDPDHLKKLGLSHSQSKFFPGLKQPDNTPTGTEVPVIGILSHDMIPRIEEFSGAGWGTQIPDAYVKFVEHSGARVVPIIYKQQTDEEVEELLSKINGVIFPGGSGDDSYEAWEKKIYLKILKMNDNGVHFPVMGICLGMQHITKYVVGRSRLSLFPLKKTPAAIHFEPDASVSKLFNSEILDFPMSDFEEQDVFYHQHNYGIAPSKWDQEESLRNELKILSTEWDTEGKEFVNIYEGINYPILGLQFHPEKATSAMSKFQPFPHSNKAIYLNRYFADYFVNEARKNNQKFSTLQEETEALIGNYAKVETDSYYGGVYLFEGEEIEINLDLLAQKAQPSSQD